MRRYLVFGCGLSLAAMLFNGCTETGATPGHAPALVACDPFEVADAAITLGTVVAVGRDSAGTLYVVDQVDSVHRVFQSSGTELMLARQSGSGAGTLADGSEFMSFSYASPVDGSSSTLAVSILGGEVRMAFAATTVPKADFELTLAAGVELEVVDVTAVAGLTLRNLPAETVVEYNALTSSGGERLLVIRPRDNWAYTDFRLFYGGDDELTECVVIEVSRAKDGGTTTIRFMLEGAEATALFPASITGIADPPSLTLEAGVVPLTKMAATDGLGELTFTCLEP